MIDKFLNNRFFILYFSPLILGSLSVFSFQPFNLTIINFFILPLLFYLIVHIKKKSKNVYRKKPYKQNLFIFGTLFGFGFYIGGIHWITNSLTFDESFKALIPLGLIFIPLFLSLFFSILILIIGPFLNFNFASILLFSAGLSFSDFLRSKILSGFPWNLWAYSFSWATEILQILNKVGLFAFNLITITIFILPVIIFFNINLKGKLFSLMILPLMLTFLFLYGDHSINSNKSTKSFDDNKINVKVISPNFELEYGLSENQIENRLNKLIRYSDPKKNKQTIFIWPEGVFSGYSYSELTKFKKKFASKFNKNHLIVFGVNRLDVNKNSYYNSLVVVDNNFEILREYNKIKLVPFGEFLPFEEKLKKIGFKKITEGHGSFLKGKEQKNLVIGKLNILPLICYEIIFTEFVQNSDPQTNLIINISEDGWFGNSIGPHQHYSKSIFRAIEQNTYLIRSTNKGVSLIMNNKGQIIKRLERLEAGNIELQVPLIGTNNKNKNDLIFFILLFTYILLFKIYEKNNVK